MKRVKGAIMNNIMVCVTKQKTCQRLIDYGKELIKDDDDQLFVIHVSGEQDQILGSTEEGKALEYLYEKAKEAGASLTVEKSNNVLKTLMEIIRKNQINEVIVGQSGEKMVLDGFLSSFQKKLKGKVKLTIIPSIS